MKKEIWKDIEGYEGLYQVSNLGRVRSLDRYLNAKDSRRIFRKSQIIKLRKDNHGYYFVGLSKNGKTKENKVHRLVATAFIENKEQFPVVHHKDSNKRNNVMENLEWCTHAENLMYEILKGEDSKIRWRKFTFEQAEQIRKEYRKGKVTQKELAKKYGVSSSVIGYIILKKTYKN